jgi:hypothetical protein
MRESLLLNGITLSQALGNSGLAVLTPFAKHDALRNHIDAGSLFVVYQERELPSG